MASYLEGAKNDVTTASRSAHSSWLQSQRPVIRVANCDAWLYRNQQMTATRTATAALNINQTGHKRVLQTFRVRLTFNTAGANRSFKIRVRCCQKSLSTVSGAISVQTPGASSGTERTLLLFVPEQRQPASDSPIEFLHTTPNESAQSKTGTTAPNFAFTYTHHSTTAATPAGKGATHLPPRLFGLWQIMLGTVAASFRQIRSEEDLSSTSPPAVSNGEVLDRSHRCQMHSMHL